MNIFDEQTLELTLKASNEGIWDWDRNTDEIYYSDRALEFLGYQQSNAPNMMSRPHDIVHPDDLEKFHKSMDQVLHQNGDDLFKINCRIIKPNKETSWVRMRGLATRVSNKMTRLTGSIIDISKRKFAEEMIAVEQNMLRLIINNTPLQIYFKDKDSCYKIVNQRQVEWLGAKNESDLINKSSETFFSEDSWKEHRKEEIRIMLSGIPVLDAIQKEEWPNKDETYVKKVKYPWYDSTNKLLGTYGISCDVTQLIKAKKKLEKLALNLQQQNKNNQEEVLLAKEIQRAILPHNTPCWNQLCFDWKSKIDIQTLYQPVSALAGDFYDVIPLTENKLGFIIIDITGHGVRSAMIISLIKGFMEQTQHLASEPSLYLKKINHDLSNILTKTSTEILISASYTILDFEKKQVITTSAGGNLPLFLNSECNIIHNDSINSPALGTDPSYTYTEKTFSLDNIQSFLLHSDGIYSTSNEKHDSKHLADLYCEAHSQSETETLEYITKMASNFNTYHFQDDVCLVNVDITANLGTLTPEI